MKASKALKISELSRNSDLKKTLKLILEFANAGRRFIPYSIVSRLTNCMRKEDIESLIIDLRSLGYNINLIDPDDPELFTIEW